jgi:protein-histidine pros-kinase
MGTGRGRRRTEKMGHTKEQSERQLTELESAHRRLEGEIAARKREPLQSQALLESAIDAMVVVNQSGKIVLINARVEKLFRYRREDLLGEEIEILVPEHFRGRHPGYRSSFMSEPQVREMGWDLNRMVCAKTGRSFRWRSA